MSGKQIKQKVAALGFSNAEFARIAKISEPTLTKIYANDRSVRPSSRGKVTSKIAEIEAQRVAS